MGDRHPKLWSPSFFQEIAKYRNNDFTVYTSGASTAAWDQKTMDFDGILELSGTLKYDNFELDICGTRMIRTSSLGKLNTPVVRNVEEWNGIIVSS